MTDTRADWPDDMFTHKHDFLKALETARELSANGDGENLGFWNAEISAFRDIHDGTEHPIPHFEAWGKAIAITRDNAVIDPPDRDDVSYWRRQERTLNNIVQEFSAAEAKPDDTPEP